MTQKHTAQTTEAMDTERETRIEEQVLVCRLTEQERAARALELCRALASANDAEDRKKAAAAAAKAECDTAWQRVEDLRRVVQSGEETREVEVECVTDYAAGQYTETRLDTLARTVSRPLKDRERQQRLELEEPVTAERRAGEVAALRDAETHGRVRRVEDGDDVAPWDA